MITPALEMVGWMSSKTWLCFAQETLREIHQPADASQSWTPHASLSHKPTAENLHHQLLPLAHQIILLCCVASTVFKRGKFCLYKLQL